MFNVLNTATIYTQLCKVNDMKVCDCYGDYDMKRDRVKRERAFKIVSITNGWNVCV